MSNITIRPSVRTDGKAILSIMDANVLWFRSIGCTLWGPELFSEDETEGAYWRDLAGTGSLLGEGTTQTFVIEVDGWQEGEQGRKVGGYYIMGKRCPRYVPDVVEPSVYLHNAAIHPDLRGKGLGAALVVHAKDIASKAGAKMIRLDAYGGTLGTTAEGAKVVEAWVKLGFERAGQVGPTGGERTDAEPWQQILALRV